MERPVARIVAGFVALTLVASGGVALTPSFDTAHQHEEHTGEIQDIAYDASTDTVWSLDKEGGFVGYDVAERSVAVSEEFDRGHALAVGNGIVYVAAGSTLWAFDTADQETTEVARLQDHAAGIAYDARRDVVWTAGHETVYGHDVSDGSVVLTHEEHTDGMSSIAVHGDHVASGTSWQDELLVYDAARDSLAWEVDFPDDVGKIGSVGFTDAGYLLVGTDAEDKSLVGMYNVETQEAVAEHRSHVFSVSDVLYHPSENLLVSAGFDNTVKLYSVDQEAVVAEHEHEDTIYAADLDTRNEVLWIGDGEQRDGLVTGLALSEQAGDAGGDATEEAPADGSTGSDGDGSTGTEGSSGEGETTENESPMGLAAAIAGVAAAALVVRRRS